MTLNKIYIVIFLVQIKIKSYKIRKKGRSDILLYKTWKEFLANCSNLVLYECMMALILRK